MADILPIQATAGTKMKGSWGIGSLVAALVSTAGCGGMTQASDGRDNPTGEAPAEWAARVKCNWTR